MEIPPDCDPYHEQNEKEQEAMKINAATNARAKNKNSCRFVDKIRENTPYSTGHNQDRVAKIPIEKDSNCQAGQKMAEK
jgi:hypothetical protein